MISTSDTPEKEKGVEVRVGEEHLGLHLGHTFHCHYPSQQGLSYLRIKAKYSWHVSHIRTVPMQLLCPLQKRMKTTNQRTTHVHPRFCLLKLGFAVKHCEGVVLKGLGDLSITKALCSNTS